MEDDLFVVHYWMHDLRWQVVICNCEAVGGWMISVVWGALSNTGRSREHNEDSILAAPTVFAVADGMGGHQAGEVASRMAVDILARLVRTAPLSVNAVLEATLLANGEIYRASALEADLAGMGTTLAGIALVSNGGEDHWLLFNVGDSRVYRLAAHRLTQLSVDHSEVAELVAQGKLEPREARAYKRRNIVTRSLGVEDPHKPDTWLRPPEVGERFLICSDGLTDELDDTEIEAMLISVEDPVQAAGALIDAANRHGGRDNISAIVVDVVELSRDLTADEDTVPRDRALALSPMRLPIAPTPGGIADVEG